jgi:hypothetical protein
VKCQVRANILPFITKAQRSAVVNHVATQPARSGEYRIGHLRLTWSLPDYAAEALRARSWVARRRQSVLPASQIAATYNLPIL